MDDCVISATGVLETGAVRKARYAEEQNEAGEKHLELGNAEAHQFSNASNAKYHWGEAHSRFTAALKLSGNGDGPRAYLYYANRAETWLLPRGRLPTFKPDHEAAVEDADTSTWLNDQYPRGFCLLGDALLRRGKARKAVEALEACLALDASSGRARELLAKARDQCAADAREAARLKAQMDANPPLAQQAADLQRLDDAFAHAALAARAPSAAAQHRAPLELPAGRVADDAAAPPPTVGDDGVEDAEPALPPPPPPAAPPQSLPDAAAAKAKGNEFMAKGMLDRAEACYLLALEIAELESASAGSGGVDCAEADALAEAVHGNLALVYLQGHRLSEAEAACDACLEYNASSLKALYRRALARTGLGDLTPALTDVRAARSAALNLCDDIAVANCRDLERRIAEQLAGATLTPEQAHGWIESLF